MKINEKSDNITLDTNEGTWYVIDSKTIEDKKYFLLEHEYYGDETSGVIVDEDGKTVLDEVWNGFDDLEYHLEALEYEKEYAKAEFSDKDLFFVDDIGGMLAWMYYNPDSNEGGQFVTNQLSFEDIKNATEHASDPSSFFNTHLASRAKQHLADIGTDDFETAKEQFTSGNHQLMGITTHTMQTLVEKADNYLKSAEMSVEVNYNQIDEVINNEYPKNGGYTILDTIAVGTAEFAVGEHEKAPSPYVTWQRNTKNDGDGTPNWFWGHYMSSKESAYIDLEKRVQEEVEIIDPPIKEKLAVFKALSSLNSKSDKAKTIDLDR